MYFYKAASDTVGAVAGKLGDSVQEIGAAGATVGHGLNKVGKRNKKIFLKEFF